MALQGDVVVGEIVDIRDYGAVVKVNRAQDALLHISQISHDKVLMKNQLKDLLKVGQRMRLKVGIFNHPNFDMINLSYYLLIW